MRKRAGILLCSMLIGLAAAGCMAIPEALGEKEAGAEQLAEPVETVAWWSLTYETPNPERLPVRVRFQWLKGLE